MCGTPSMTPTPSKSSSSSLSRISLLQRKSDLFLLLTAGGLRELDSVAYNLVIAEDHERKEHGSLAGSGMRSLADLSNTSLSGDQHQQGSRRRGMGMGDYLSDLEEM